MKKLVASIICSLLLVGCGKSLPSMEHNERLVEVKKERVLTKLFYHGRISPLKLTPIIAPYEGTVLKIHAAFGSRVKEGDLLITLKSDSLQKEYRSDLTQFLNAKNRYENSLQNFKGTQALFKAGIVDQQTYITEKSNVESNKLSYANAKNQLSDTIGRIPDFKAEFEKLSLDNFETVQKMLNKKFDQLNLYAPSSGVVLLPPDQGKDSSKELKAGVTVKKEMALATIGDLSGVSITVKANESDINDIKVGEKVIVTTPALPNIKLHGIVAAVGAQAHSTNSDSQATFPVTVVVPKLTLQEQTDIRVGISAKVEIDIDAGEKLKVPIDAVYREKGQDKIKRVNKESGETEAVDVVTGRTSENTVVIEKGLSEGDKILVSD